VYSNQLNLPEPFLRAAEAREYSKGDARYSVTELIDPPRYGALRRLYKDVIVEDIADNIGSLMGTMFHKMLEYSGAPKTGAILEERLYAEVDGVKISGAMDHTILTGAGQLDDYKETKVYSVRQALRHGKPEWTAQLNIYRWLRALHGQQVEALNIIARMKDWNMAFAIADAQKEVPGDYPAHEIAVVPITVWPLEKTEAYVRDRIQLHLAADAWVARLENGEGSHNPPFCSDEERWRNPTRWAVMKEGRKTAIKLYDDKPEADFVAGQTKGGYVEQRGGEYKRCMLWCSVGRAGLCTQWEADKAAAPSASNIIDTSVFD